MTPQASHSTIPTNIEKLAEQKTLFNFQLKPVSTAAVVFGAGVAGVYNVATLPGSQRRGYGEAIMRHALEEAHRQHGVETTILQSTPAGYRLYERMGYRTVISVAVYST